MPGRKINSLFFNVVLVSIATKCSLLKLVIAAFVADGSMRFSYACGGVVVSIIFPPLPGSSGWCFLQAEKEINRIEITIKFFICSF